MIFNIKHTANWEYIRQRKQNLINKNNKRENAGRILHEGPYEGVKVNDNGTVCMQKGVVTDTVNIRNIHPCQE